MSTFNKSSEPNLKIIAAAGKTDTGNNNALLMLCKLSKIFKQITSFATLYNIFNISSEVLKILSKNVRFFYRVPDIFNFSECNIFIKNIRNLISKPRFAKKFNHTLWRRIFYGIIARGIFMKKKYDMWKIVTTLITMIFIAVMVILNLTH